jgi:hypothetical protein
MLDVIFFWLLAILAVAISVLGVTSNDPKYRFMFYVLGTMSVVLIIVTGYRNYQVQKAADAAQQDLTSKVADLRTATAEISRVQDLNTKLQNRLLTQSGTIASLARESVSQMTGTFCYFMVAPNLGSGNPVSFPLQLWVHGKYPMREVTSVIQKADEFVITQNLVQPTLPLPKTLLPGVSGMDYRLGTGEFHIQTYCAAGGPINEVIRLKLIDGKLVTCPPKFSPAKI